MEESTGSNLYMEGFIPLPSYRQTPACLFPGEMESCWTLRFQVQRKSWVRIKSENRETKWKPAHWLGTLGPAPWTPTANFLWLSHHPPPTRKLQTSLLGQMALNKSTEIWEFPKERRAYYMNILQWGIPAGSHTERRSGFSAPQFQSRTWLRITKNLGKAKNIKGRPKGTKQKEKKGQI